ncbi:hypothetical protein N7486_011325 [Penicillium sp. IBT 16267x]|nr:hypothetical protein N7486_011325 [Penicillium sp. IBT 16267x]
MPSPFGFRAKFGKKKSPPKSEEAVTVNSEPSVGAVTTNKEDLWAQAKQSLSADPKKKEILDEATGILEAYGLKLDGNHQQLCSFLDDRVSELEEKKWMVKDIVSAAASASPPAAIACVGVTVCLMLFIQGVESQNDLLQGLDTTATLIPRLHMMEDLYLHSDSVTELTVEFIQTFKAKFTTLLSKVLEFQARALCYLQRGSLARFSRGMLKQDPWEALVQEMKSLESELEKFTVLIEAAENKLERQRREHELEKALQEYQIWQITSNRDEKVNNLLRKLNDHRCPYQDRKNLNNKRVPKTCEWFTQHERFKIWDQSPETCLLWVSADPGCGKSVLAKYPVDEVLPRPRKRTVCFFFFKDVPDQKSSTSALCAMIRNILMCQPSLLSDHMLNKVDTDGDKLFQSFDGLWNIFMAITANPQAGDIICVVDALDECQDDDRDQLIRAVGELYLRGDNKRTLKFLITSRPYDHIRNRFQQLEDRMIHLSGENQDEVEKISREINLVIASRVDEISRQRSLESTEREFLREQLMSIPNRTYLWVCLTLDYIESTPGFTKGNVRRTIHQDIPDTVDEAYNKILNRSVDHKKARKLLQLVTVAMRPLSVEEVSLALAIKTEPQSYEQIKDEIEPVERFKSTLRQMCGLLLTVIDDKVYLLRQTVKEFLVKTKSTSDYIPSKNDWKHSLVPTNSNKVMAEICIRYLLANLSATDLGKFMEYSARSWTHHFSQADYHEQDETELLAIGLCEVEWEVFKNWAEIHSEIHRQTLLLELTTPLMVASLLGLEAVVRRLLQIGRVDVNSKTSYDETPLSLAARNGQEAVANLLLETGEVDVNSKTSYNGTPLSLAAQDGHEAVVKLLLETGKVNVDSKDSWNETPLSLATQDGHEAVVKLLLETGKVDVNSKNSSNETPLSLAAKYRYEAVAKLLLETGKADVNCKDSQNETPLSSAAGNGDEAVVKLLLGTGKVDVNSKDLNSDTPLSLATKYGHEAVVKLLLETGKVDVNSKDSKNRTPLSLATRYGYKGIVKLLEMSNS